MADEPIPQTRPIVTRAQARADGLTHYFTGKPCKSGHVAERYLSNGSCVDCERIKQHSASYLNNHKKYKSRPDIKARHNSRHQFRYMNDPNYKEKILVY